VLVVGEGDVVENRQVELGVARSGLVQIRSGLRTGERIVVDGLQKARPGSAVSPRIAEPAAPAASPVR
jgi:multidrug efflux pump subunit AcrA (membrane-fusion protein)